MEEWIDAQGELLWKQLNACIYLTCNGSHLAASVIVHEISLSQFLVSQLSNVRTS